MIRGRTVDEVRRYDYSKLAVLLILLLLLLCVVFNRCGVPLVTPTVNLPNGGKALTNEDIGLNGTAEADSDLQIVLDGNVIGDTDVGANGQWSYTTQVGDPGEYEVTVQSVDGSGNVLASSESADLSVEMATVSVDAPTINLPSGPLFANQAVTLDGTGSPDYGLQVLLDGEVAGEADVGSNGQWSYTTDIGDAGEYEVSVQSVDADGNVLASSNAASLAVAEAVPLTLQLPNGGEVASDEEITLSGTAQPGSEVEISVDGQVVGLSKVGADGQWSFDSEISEPGEHEISVQALNPNGSVIASADPATLSVTGADAAAEAEGEAEGEAEETVPTLTLPAGGEVGSGEDVTLSGTGTPGSEVQILVDGEVAGSTTVGDDGNWSFTTQISDPGEHEISVEALDASGTVVASSDPASLTVGDGAGAGGAVTLKLPSAETPLSSGLVSLSGTGEPGSDIEVLVDGQPVGRTKVRPDGTWSLRTRISEPGDHEVSAQALDGDGNVIASADPATLTIADAGALTLNLPSGANDATSDEEITLSGEGEPGSEVEILVDGEVVGTTTVGDDGKWSLSTTISDPGEHEIQAQALDGDGNVLVRSDALPVSIVAPGTLTANLPANGQPLSKGEATFTGRGEPGEEVQVVVDGEVVGTTTVDDDGKWALTANLNEPGTYEVAVQTLDGSGNVVSESEPTSLEVADTELTVDVPSDAELSSGGEVALSGTGEPGSDVQVVVDGEVVGSAKVDADGKWSFPTQVSDLGTGDVRVQAVDENGSIVASSNPALIAGLAAAAAGAGAGSGTDTDTDTDTGAGGLSVNLPGNGAPLSQGDATFSGQGTPGSEVQVVVDGDVVGTTTVDPDGNWSLTADIQEPGDYDVAVQEVDGSGEVVAQSDPASLTVAEGAPLTVDLPDGGVALNDEDVTLSGTGEPGSEVEVLVDGEVVGTATVDDDGNWSLATPIEEPGQHDISVQTVADDGSVQVSSNPAGLSVAEPGQLTLQVPSGGSLDSGDVTLNGTGEPGSEVQIVLDGEVVGTTTVGDDGKWAFTTPVSEPGQYEVSAQVVDDGGQVVASSEPAALNIGTGAGGAAASLGTLTLPPDVSANEATTLSGTGPPGSNVEIVIDGEVVGTAPIDDDGNWSFDTEFGEAGEYEVIAQIVDDSGQVVVKSKPASLPVGSAAAAPTVELPTDASAGDEVTLSGTGTPGSEVQILVDGEVVGTATVGDDGNWSFDTEIADAGDYQVSIQALDAGGDVVAESDAASLTVADGAVAGQAPTIQLPTAVSAGDEVTLSGTGTPGSEVQIVLDGEVVGTATVDDDGNWSFDSQIADAGDYQVSVQALDAGGEVVAESDAASLTVADGAVAGQAPTIELPTAVSAGDEVTLSGTGEPGSEVQIVLDGEVVGTATVDDDGNWSFDTEIADAGDYEVSVQALDAGGEVVAESDAASLTVADGAVAGQAPTIELPTAVSAGDEVTLSGTGEPGSDVQIVVDGEVVGSATVGDDGNWSFDSEITNAGDYQVSVQSVDAGGEVVAQSDAASLTVDALAGQVPTLNRPTAASAGDEVTLTGTGAAGSEVEILFDGQVIGTVTVGDDGNWSFSRLINEAGQYDVVAQAINRNGVVVGYSQIASLEVTGIATEVVAPTLSVPTGASAGDEVTFTGTGEPGSTVQVMVNGEIIGTTTVGSNGSWSLASVLKEAGDYEVTAQAIDDNEQVVAKSDSASLSLSEAGEEAPSEEEQTAGEKPTKVVCQADHIVQTDDWLRTLADTYWGDFTLFPAIVEGTNVKNAEDDSYNFIANPNFIKPGWKLCIVDAETARLLLQ